MELEIIAIYCWCDLILNSLNVKENSRAEMSEAEVITTAIVAVRFFSGNFENARRFLGEHGYIPNMLTKSRLNRRLHKLGPELICDVQRVIGEVFKATNSNQEYEEDLLLDAASIELKPQRKGNAKRRFDGCTEYIIHQQRKMVETVFSGIARLFPKHIHAVTSRGFELKVALFACAAGLSSLVSLSLG